MMELVFCTNSNHKLREVAQLIGAQIQFRTLEEIGYTTEIPEPFETLEENSMSKANQVHVATDKNCFAEDTGLFIEALNGEPGVYSARYAGEPSNSNLNIEKVLSNLEGNSNRNAYFKTIITLILDKKVYQFEGKCEGTISDKCTGNDGFGYDPIFIPNGETRSFSELSAEEKNSISHRRKAFDKMADFLKNYSL